MSALTMGLLLLVGPAPSSPHPSPDLSPSEVIRTVVEALRNNNSPIPNAGIFTAYQFASPANHAVTGPYGRFLWIAKSDEFAPMFGRPAGELIAIEIAGDHAEQALRIPVDGGQIATFRFSLSRQTDGACRWCWMIDGVVRLP